MTPNLYIIAGPNGAGKTTFANQFLPNYAECREFVNADLIAGGLSPFLPERAEIQAGRSCTVFWCRPRPVSALRRLPQVCYSQSDDGKARIDPLWLFRVCARVAR